MAEASWGDCSAHSSPHGSCGSPTDLLPRPRHRGADTPSTLRRHSLSRKAAVWHLFFGTDVCRASTCLIWGYFSTVPAGLSRDEFVKYRPDSGEKLVPIAIGTVAIPFLGWYNMENVENCRMKRNRQIGIWRIPCHCEPVLKLAWQSPSNSGAKNVIRRRGAH